MYPWIRLAPRMDRLAAASDAFSFASQMQQSLLSLQLAGARAASDPRRVLVIPRLAFQ